MTLTQEQINSFLAERRNAVLGTIRKDGAPQLNPMWFHWTGEVFYISTTKTRFKYMHLRRDPRVTLCIDESPGFKSVIVSGRAEIVEEDIWGPTKQIVEKYVRSDQVDARLARLRTEPRVLLVIHPEKWVSWDLGRR
jgi:PPOX class probable F420-dependent enzyme